MLIEVSPLRTEARQPLAYAERYGAQFLIVDAGWNAGNRLCSPFDLHDVNAGCEILRGHGAASGRNSRRSSVSCPCAWDEHATRGSYQLPLIRTHWPNRVGRWT